MIKACLDYHRETSYERYRMGGHSLDWANQPEVFKTYEGIKPLKLLRETEFPKQNLSSLLFEKTSRKARTEIDLATLSTLLLLTHTVTAKARSQDGDFYFRSAASAGALYPTEIYTATNGVTGLRDGLYHYALHEHALVPLRSGGFEAPLPEPEGSEDMRLPVVTFFLTAVFFRSAWKYRSRAYRYHLMDTGHVEENLILAVKAQGFSCQESYDFDDDYVNQLLGLDETREAALALVFLPGREAAKQGKGAGLDRLPEPILRASRVSAGEVDYPLIREMHEAGKKRIAGRGERVVVSEGPGIGPEEWIQTEPPASWNEIADYPDCVFTRRSRRNFLKRPVSREHMGGLLQSMYVSGSETYGESLTAGFLSERVEGMEAGLYLLDRNRKASGLVARGAYLEPMSRICLDQAWLLNASVHFLFLADLEALDRTWGPRGYRYAMMTAGRLGQRLYITASAMGLGCCGIGAFYDGEAGELLGLKQNSRLLYLVAVGVVKRR